MTLRNGGTKPYREVILPPKTFENHAVSTFSYLLPKTVVVKKGVCTSLHNVELSLDVFFSLILTRLIRTMSDKMKQLFTYTPLYTPSKPKNM